MDLSFYIYLFLAIASISGGSYYFFKSNSSIAGSIYLLGSIVIAAFFGSRWFLPSGVVSTSGVWPPTINVCPDFMSLVTLRPAAANGATSSLETVCVDTIGVYANGIAKWTPGSTSENTIFRLFAGSDAATRRTRLIDQCKAKKVSWEGFYVSEPLGDRLPPLPPAQA